MSNPLKRDLWYFHMKAEEIEEKVWTFCQLTDQLEEIKVDFIKRGTNTSTVDKWLHIAGEQMIKFIKGIDDCSAALYDHYGVSQQFALDCTVKILLLN